MDKTLSLLGLAMKAGKVLSGEFSVEQGIKDGSVSLCIIATDASDNTKKKFNNMCTYRSIQLIELSTKAGLGQAIGKEYRATLGLTDDGFVKAILAKVSE